MDSDLMNARITFFSKSGGFSDSGDILDDERKKVITCWAEVLKTNVKEIQRRNQLKETSLIRNENTEVFIIRYELLTVFNELEDDELNTLVIHFNGVEYEVVEMKPNHTAKDKIAITAKAVF